MLRLARMMLVLSVVLFAYSFALSVKMFWPLSLWGLIAAGYVVSRQRRRVRWTTLGSARWAEWGELRRAGMIGGASGLCVGQLIEDRQRSSSQTRMRAIMRLFDVKVSDDEALRFLGGKRAAQAESQVRLSRAVHTAVFSPSGGGKGVSCVLPFLMTCEDSCVVIDFKGENAKITAAMRRDRLRQRVVIIDPFQQVTQNPDTFNPLDSIDSNNPHSLDDVADVANALVVRTGEEREPHWNDSAEMWIGAITGMVAHYGNREDGTRSLQTVREILSDPQKLELAIKVLMESDRCGGILARQGGQLRHFVDKEKSSTLTTVSRHLRFLDSTAVASCMARSSFDPRDLKRQKMTVYLVLPPDHMRAQSALLRLWVGSLLRSVIKEGTGEGRKVHFVLDEAASLGHLECIDDALDKYRAFGIRLQFYFQSMGQLRKCFPDGADQTLLSNTSHVFFGVNDHGLGNGVGTADYVSARLGDSTVIVDSGGSSVTRSSQWSNGNSQSSHSGGVSRSYSDNWGQQARRLLQPNEVVNLHPRMAITFTPGVPPIRTWLQRYYEMNHRDLRPRRRGMRRVVGTLLVSALILGVSVGTAVLAVQEEHELRNRPRPIPHRNYIYQRYSPGLPANPRWPSYGSHYVQDR